MLADRGVYDGNASALKRSGDSEGASMKVTGITPILNVSDVAASIAWFERLGGGRQGSR